MVSVSSKQHYYLARLEGVQDIEGFWTWYPPHFKDVIGSWSDLRSLPQQARQPNLPPEGYGLFAYATPKLIPGSIYLGDDLKAKLSASDIDKLSTALGLGPGGITGETLEEILWELVGVHADPSGKTRWRTLKAKPSTGFKYVIGAEVMRQTWDEASDELKAKTLEMAHGDWLKQKQDFTQSGHWRRTLTAYARTYEVSIDELLKKWGEPSIQSWEEDTTWTESFDKADGAPLGPDLTWTDVRCTWETINNTGTPIENNQWCSARADAAVDTDDHYVEDTVSWQITHNTHVGMCARFDAAAETYYVFWSRGADNQYYLYKWIGGAATLLQSAAGFLGNGDRGRLEVDDGDLEGFDLGVSVITFTDSPISITGNLMGGIFGRQGGFRRARHNDYEIGDLHPPTPPPTPTGIAPSFGQNVSVTVGSGLPVGPGYGQPIHDIAATPAWGRPILRNLATGYGQIRMNVTPNYPGWSQRDFQRAQG